MVRFGPARMRRPENSDRDARIMTLLHQMHDCSGQIDLGVERLAHSHAAQAAQGCGRGSLAAHLHPMFARKHMLRWLTTLYRQPDPLANSAKICPIKPNHFSTEPSSNGRLAEALRTRNPRWTTRALWYPPAQSRRHLPNAGSAVGRTGRTGYGIKGHARSQPARVGIPP